MANRLHLITESKEFEWEERGSSERNCKGCQTPTRGRADYTSKHFSYANRPCCMSCAIEAAFEE